MQVFVLFQRCAFKEREQQLDWDGFRRESGVLRHLLCLFQARQLASETIQPNVVPEPFGDFSRCGTKHCFDDIRELEGTGKGGTTLKQFRSVFDEFVRVHTEEILPPVGKSCTIKREHSRYILFWSSGACNAQ